MGDILTKPGKVKIEEPEELLGLDLEDFEKGVSEIYSSALTQPTTNESAIEKSDKWNPKSCEQVMDLLPEVFEKVKAIEGGYDKGHIKYKLLQKGNMAANLMLSRPDGDSKFEFSFDERVYDYSVEFDSASQFHKYRDYKIRTKIDFYFDNRLELDPIFFYKMNDSHKAIEIFNSRTIGLDASAIRVFEKLKEGMRKLGVVFE